MSASDRERSRAFWVVVFQFSVAVTLVLAVTSAVHLVTVTRVLVGHVETKRASVDCSLPSQ